MWRIESDIAVALAFTSRVYVASARSMHRAVPAARLERSRQRRLAGLLRIAVQVQNTPARGISSVSNILSGTAVGTFSDPSPALVFGTSSLGDVFERLGKPRTLRRERHRHNAFELLPDDVQRGLSHSGGNGPRERRRHRYRVDLSRPTGRHARPRSRFGHHR